MKSKRKKSIACYFWYEIISVIHKYLHTYRYIDYIDYWSTNNGTATIDLSKMTSTLNMTFGTSITSCYNCASFCVHIYIYRVADRRNLVWWTSAENYLQDSAAPKNHVIIVSYFGPLTKNMKPKYWQSIIIFVILIYSYMYFIPSWKSKLFKPDYFWIWLSEKNFRFIGSLFTWWNACRKKTKV